jgi:6-phosphogluconolactonase (cycloisomerase 2 family)
LGNAPTGDGVDIIAYNPALRHVYAPAENDGSVTVVEAEEQGNLHSIRTLQAAKGTHCAASDDKNQVFVCDPEHGRIIVFSDAAGK